MKARIRVTRDCNWYWVDKKIMNFGPNIGVIPFAAYHILCSFVNEDSGSCYPSIKTIADCIGVSERSVTRAIQILLEVKLIEVTRRFNGSNVYKILPMGGDIQSPGDSQSLGGDSQSSPLVTHSPSNKHNTNKHYLTSEPSVLTDSLLKPNTSAVKPNKEVIEHFVSSYKAKLGHKYHFLPKDAKLISDLLAITDKFDVMKRIDFLFTSNDKFYKEAGYTVGVLYACFNKLNENKTLRV